jgi:hypothetical protein
MKAGGVAIWAGLFGLAVWTEWGLVFCILSLIVLVFLNLRTEESPDGVSAYSVFNRAGRALPGTFDARDVDAAIRNLPMKKEQMMPLIEEEQEIKVRRGKAANQDCQCGSGRKYKKCCGKTLTAAERKVLEMEREQWEKEWT